MALGPNHWVIIGMHCGICAGINLGFGLLSFMEEREREGREGERERGGEREKEREREGEKGSEERGERQRETEIERGVGWTVLLWNYCHKLAINLI